MDGLQVWRHSNEFRNVYTNYKDRRKTSRGIHALTNQLFEEVYGDRVQALHLLDYHNKSIILIQNLQIKTFESLVKGFKPVVFEGEKYHTFLWECNATFESAIKMLYQFCCYWSTNYLTKYDRYTCTVVQGEYDLSLYNLLSDVWI